MPRETLRRREQKAAAFAVLSGTATRRPIDAAEAKALFYAIDSKDAAGFGIRKLSTLDLDILHEAPPCITWEPRITLIAYAAWRRRDHFINGLLRAGADPAARWASKPLPTGVAPGSAALAAVPAGRVREYLLGLRPQLAVWVVRTLVLLRHAGARRAMQLAVVTSPDAATSPDVATPDTAISCPSHCECQECGAEEAYQPLAWEPCGHFYCEPCFWAYLLDDVPGESERISLHCPACGVRPPTGPGSNGKARDSEMAPPATAKPGVDWDCSHCGYSNFARRSDCRNCGHCWQAASSDVAAIAVAPVSTATLLPTVEVELTPMERREASLQKWTALPLDKCADQPLAKRFQKFQALDPEAAAAAWLGNSRNERTLELLKAGTAGDVRRLAALVEAGVNIDAQNEYGQNALFLAACHGHEPAVRILLASSADPEHIANGGSTSAVSAAAAGHSHVLLALRDAGADVDRSGSEGLSASEYMERINRSGAADSAAVAPLFDPQVKTLIDIDRDHAGAGSCYLDGVFEEDFLCRLEDLFRCLPVAPRTKDCSNDRSYFCDSEGWLRRGLAQALARACAVLGPESDAIVPVEEAMAHMRFLHYSAVGGGLPPHVDLARTDASGQRSTHTFILYLTDCDMGGETVLLERIPEQSEAEGPTSSAPALAAVVPRRGRLLVFPHLCPHLARPVIEVPKLLLRGEMYRRR